MEARLIIGLVPQFEDDSTTHLILKAMLIDVEWNRGKVLGLLEYM